MTLNLNNLKLKLIDRFGCPACLGCSQRSGEAAFRAVQRSAGVRAGEEEERGLEVGIAAVNVFIAIYSFNVCPYVRAGPAKALPERLIGCAPFNTL